MVLGSSNTDMIIRLKRLPHAGETLLGGEFMTAAGGKGANQAVAAARAGGRVSFIARVGRDAMGDRAIAGYVRDGLNVTFVTRDRHRPSGAALIFVADSGENSIAVASGANDRLSTSDVKKARAVIKKAAILLMQLETPLATVRAAARLAAENGGLVILNPAPARRLPAEFCRHVSIITPNALEAELMTGIKVNNIAAAGKAALILCRCGVQTVILTLGARGALVVNARGSRHIPGFKVKAVDTTGAGDVFNGAFAVALTEKRPIDEAVRFANAAAAISVTSGGAQPSAPSRQAIEKFLKSH